MGVYNQEISIRLTVQKLSQLQIQKLKGSLARITGVVLKQVIPR